MKKYNTTPAKWLSFFSSFAIFTLLISFAIILFTNSAEKFQLMGTNYNYPIQTQNKIFLSNQGQDSIFTGVKKSKLVSENEKLFNAEMFAVEMKYKLNPEKYPKLHWFYKGIVLLFILTAIFEFYLFRKVMQNFIHKNPFDLVNVKLLRRAGYIALSMSILGIILLNSAQFIEASLFDYKIRFASRFSFDLIPFSFWSTAFFFVIAEILKIGINYKQENDLTV